MEERMIRQLETLEFNARENILKVNGEDFGGNRVDQFKLEFDVDTDCRWHFSFRKTYKYYSPKEETEKE